MFAKFLKNSFFLVIILTAENAMAEGFKLDNLPRGKSITLPTLISTLLTKKKSIKVTSTDSAQVLKITRYQAEKKGPIKIAIYDNYLDRVKYLNVYRGKPVLYTFQNLSSIQIVSNVETNQKSRYEKIKIESNGPISISH